MKFLVLPSGGSALTAESRKDAKTLKKYCDDNKLEYYENEYIRHIITFPNGDVRTVRCYHKFWKQDVALDVGIAYGVLTELTAALDFPEFDRKATVGCIEDGLKGKLKISKDLKKKLNER